MGPPLPLLRAVELLGGEAIRRRRLDAGAPSRFVLEVECEEARQSARDRHDGGRPQQRRCEPPDGVVRHLPDPRDLLLRAIADDAEVAHRAGDRSRVWVARPWQTGHQLAGCRHYVTFPAGVHHYVAFGHCIAGVRS